MDEETDSIMFESELIGSVVSPERHDTPGDPLLSLSLHPRLAWLMLYQQTRSVSEVCRRFGISRKTFYKWLKRYQSASGDSRSLVDRSRRPNRFPRATPETSIQLIKKAKEETGFGQRRLKAYLADKYNINLSERTIWKLLKRHQDSGEAEAQPRAVVLGKG